MYEVVRQNADVSTEVFRSDDTDAYWVVAFQRPDELLRPAGRQHLRIVVDAVEVVDVVEVRFHHRIVLRPGRLPGIVAFHQRQVFSGYAAVSAGPRRCSRVELSPERVTQPPIGEHPIATVVRQIERVDETLTGRMAERRQERVKELKLCSDVALGDVAESSRRDCTSNGDDRLGVCRLLNRTVNRHTGCGKHRLIVPEERHEAIGAAKRPPERNSVAICPQVLTGEVVQDAVDGDNQHQQFLPLPQILNYQHSAPTP